MPQQPSAISMSPSMQVLAMHGMLVYKQQLFVLG
jgi:hypothetical protein